jgi:hypothetical protein
MSLGVVRHFLGGINADTTQVDTIENVILGTYEREVVQKHIEDAYGP